MKNFIYAAIAAVLAAVAGTQVYSQTTTFPPPAGTIVTLCTYQSNEANAAMTSGRPGFMQCDNRGYLKVTPTGSGGGGAVTIADGADVAQGARADVAYTSGNGTTISLLKATVSALGFLTSQVQAAIPAGSNNIGYTGTRIDSARLSSSPISFSSAGNNLIVPRTVATLKIYQMILSCASSTNITVMNGTSVSASGIMPLTSMYLVFNGEPFYTTTSTNSFYLNQPTAVACGGNIYYLEN